MAIRRVGLRRSRRGAGRYACCDSLRLLVRETTRQPWAQAAFQKRFAAIREAAIAGDQKAELSPCPELAGLQFRDLRRTIIVRLAEARVDLPGIVAISGHKIEQCKPILETYLPRTTKMATAAIAQFEAHRQQQETPAEEAGEQQA